MATTRFRLVIAIMAVSTVGTYLLEPYVGAHSFEEYRAATPFTLTTIDGTEFNLSSQSGKFVILDFMATWCPPCRETMRQLKMVRGAHTPDELAIVSIDIDFTEWTSDLAAFRARYAGYEHSSEGYAWYFAMDTTEQFVGPNYGANALPTLVLIDSAGKIRRTWVGAVSAGTIEQAIEGILAGAPGPYR